MVAGKQIGDVSVHGTEHLAIRDVTVFATQHNLQRLSLRVIFR